MFSIARPSWDVRRPAPRSTVSPTSALPGESRAQVLAPRLGIAFVLLGALIFALETANDIPKGEISWDWKRFAVFPVGGAIGAIVTFVLSVGVSALKRSLGKFPTTAEWAARFLGYAPDVPPGPVTVSTAGARAVFFLTVAAVVAGGAGGLVLGAGEELAVYLPNGQCKEHSSPSVDWASVVCDQLQRRRCCLSRPDRAQAKS